MNVPSASTVKLDVTPLGPQMLMVKTSCGPSMYSPCCAASGNARQPMSPIMTTARETQLERMTNPRFEADAVEAA